MALESVRHRLGAAVQFIDAFTSKPVDVPLDVRAETLPILAGMPHIPWRAVRGPNDDTYRFLVTNAVVMPVGGIPVTVTAPGNQYVDFEPFVMTLPRPFVAHPPTPARSDFRVQHILWPTRSLILPAGETAIVGRFTSGGMTPTSALKVTIWPDGLPMPPAPYTYSNEHGEFVYRLPDLKTVNGGVISTTASLQIDLKTPPTYVTSVAPTQIATDLGVVLAVPFAVRLGHVTNLSITLP
jgi:hypothetical protein